MLINLMNNNLQQQIFTILNVLILTQKTVYITNTGMFSKQCLFYIHLNDGYTKYSHNNEQKKY